jgi:hypothetical protein
MPLSIRLALGHRPRLHAKFLITADRYECGDHYYQFGFFAEEELA